MAITLYGYLTSGPCRMVGMTLEFVGKKYEYKVVDLMNGDHKSPDYLKVNPLGVVPTLVDDDFTMMESRAIAAYIANTYGSHTQILPEDKKIRARIHQLLFFEMGSFYKAFGDCSYPVAYHQIDHVPEAKIEALKVVLNLMEDMLKETGFFAGTKSISLADIVFMANFASLVECGFYPALFQDYPGLKTWFEKCKSLIPNYEECNGKGAMYFGAWFKSGIKQ